MGRGTLTAIGYVRVSTEGQAENGASLAAQRAAIEAEAIRRGWALRVFEDAGASGANLRRPGLEAALAALQPGATLIVAKLDRLSRSLADFAQLMERARREGWSLIALDLGVDTTTPSGELVANVMVAVAQWERRAIGERTRAALAEKRAAGVRLGRPRSLPERVRKRILLLRERGESYAAIASALNADCVPTAHGGLCWRASSVRAVAKQVGEPSPSG